MMDTERFGGIIRLYGMQPAEKLAAARVAVVGIGFDDEVRRPSAQESNRTAPSDPISKMDGDIEDTDVEMLLRLGYERSLRRMVGEERVERIKFDPIRQELADFKLKNVHPGEHNQPDIQACYPFRDFAPEARPLPGEIMVDTTRQLFMQCKRLQLSHLVYIGFAINWCLQMSPCCMTEMLRHGVLCSTVRECTTAVENKESAPQELAKALEMWKVALQFGFVYEYKDIVEALQNKKSSEGKLN